MFNPKVFFCFRSSCPENLASLGHYEGESRICQMFLQKLLSHGGSVHHEHPLQSQEAVFFVFTEECNK